MIEDRVDLPNGWTWATVTDVITGIQPGFASGQKRVQGGIPHLRMNNIGSDCRLNLDSVCTVPSHLAKPRHFLQCDDILVCHTNSVKLVGKVALFNLEGGPYAFSNHLSRLRIAADIVDARWLWYVLATLWRERYFENRCKQWVNQATVERETLLAAPVPLPPIAEQKRIIARIEALSRQSRAAREALEHIPPLLKRFRQAVLAAAFRGDLVPQDSADEPAVAILKRIQAQRKALPLLDTSALLDLPKEWAWTTIGEVAETTSGGTPLRNHPEYYHGTIPWIKSGELEDNIISDAEEFITGEGLKNSSAKVFPKGTALVALYGATVGKTGILGIDAATNQAVCAVFPLNEAFTAEFITYWLQYQRQKLIDQSAGGAQPNISQRILRAFPMPLVPLAEQRRIVARIQEFFARAEAVEAAVAIARRRLDKLDQAILARAFRGELVPQSQ